MCIRATVQRALVLLAAAPAGMQVADGQSPHESPRPGSSRAPGWAEAVTADGEEYHRLAYDSAWRDGGFEDDTTYEWFGSSREPRGPRPALMAQLNHSVGTVYTHSVNGARGVIIGWDARSRVPLDWLDRNVPQRADGTVDWSDRVRRLYTPWYSVLEERSGANPRHAHHPHTHTRLWQVPGCRLHCSSRPIVYGCSLPSRTQPAAAVQCRTGPERRTSPGGTHRVHTVPEAVAKLLFC